MVVVVAVVVIVAVVVVVIVVSYIMLTAKCNIPKTKANIPATTFLEHNRRDRGATEEQ